MPPTDTLRVHKETFRDFPRKDGLPSTDTQRVHKETFQDFTEKDRRPPANVQPNTFQDELKPNQIAKSSVSEHWGREHVSISTQCGNASDEDALSKMKEKTSTNKESGVSENSFASPTSSLVAWPGSGASKANQSEANSEIPATTQNPIPFQSSSKEVHITSKSSSEKKTLEPTGRQVEPPRTLSVPTRHLPKPLSTTFPPGPPFRWLQAGSAPGGKEGHNRQEKAATVDEDQGQSDLTMVGLPNYESESKRSKQPMPPSYDESTTTLITKQTRARYHICKSTRFRETLNKLSKVKRCVSRVSFGARTYCLFRAFWHRFPIKWRSTLMVRYAF